MQNEPPRADRLAARVARSRRVRSNGRARVLFVDEFALQREGMSVLVDREADFKAIGHAGTLTDALILCAQLAPDAIVTDLSLTDTTAASAVLAFRRKCS